MGSVWLWGLLNRPESLQSAHMTMPCISHCTLQQVTAARGILTSQPHPQGLSASVHGNLGMSSQHLELLCSSARLWALQCHVHAWSPLITPVLDKAGFCSIPAPVP